MLESKVPEQNSHLLHQEPHWFCWLRWCWRSAPSRTLALPDPSLPPFPSTRVVVERWLREGWTLTVFPTFVEPRSPEEPQPGASRRTAAWVVEQPQPITRPQEEQQRCPQLKLILLPQELQGEEALRASLLVQNHHMVLSADLSL